jgi:hypothetical protein
MKIVFRVWISYLFRNNNFHFEIHSVIISKTGLHKTRKNQFCTFATNTCGHSVCNINTVDIAKQRISMCRYIYVKFANDWFTPYEIKLTVSVFIIILLCFLIDNRSLNPKEHSTFKVRIHLFSTSCFDWFFRLKLGRITTI